MNAKAKIGSEKKVTTPSSLHFYQNDRLTTQINAEATRQVLRAHSIALAQLDQMQSAKLLQADRANSILSGPLKSMAYTPYGCLNEYEYAVLLAFSGQWLDPVTRGYSLGNGYRLFIPCLLRFCSPDELSPFGRGGLNAYTYCEGDPVNNIDPSGRAIISWGIKKHFVRKQRYLRHLNKKISNAVSEQTAIIEGLQRREIDGTPKAWNGDTYTPSAIVEHYTNRKNEMAKLGNTITRTEDKIKQLSATPADRATDTQANNLTTTRDKFDEFERKLSSLRTSVGETTYWQPPTRTNSPVMRDRWFGRPHRGGRFDQ